MKKNLLLSSLLLVTLVSYTKEKPNLQIQKGIKKTYVTEKTIEAPYPPDYATTHIIVESLYEITDATPDGFILDVRNTSVSTDIWSDKKGNEKIGKPVFSFEGELEKDAHYIFATDKAGRIWRLLNFDEVREKRKSTLYKYFAAYMEDTITAEDPKTYQVLLDSAINANLDEMTEESVLKMFQYAITPLGLNGKEIVSGTEEEYEVKKGIKMKRTFREKSNGVIKSTSSLNMTAEEIEDYYSKPYKEALSQIAKDENPTKEELCNLTSANLSNTKTEGPVCLPLIPTFDIKASEKATVTFQRDGWVKNINYTSSLNEYGVTTKTTYRIYCKPDVNKHK